MKKRPFLSLLLTLSLLLSMVVLPIHAETAVTLADPGFEGSIWSDGIWSYWCAEGGSWSDHKAQDFLYSTDEWMTPPAEGGNQCIKFDINTDGGTFYMTQVLTDVPAGTYTVTAQSMGSGGETVAVVLGEMVGETVQTDSGYNNWVASSGTFAITEDCAQLIVGVRVTGTAGGWGYIDNLTIEAQAKQEPEDPVTPPTGTEIALPNGDFELGTSEGWTLTGYSEVAQDEWAKNNASYALSLWLSDDAEASGAASYTVKLTAGTYRFTFDLSGGAQDSGLGYTVTAKGTELAKSEGTYTTGGWDVWQTETTGDFTLTETTEVTFTLSGTQSAKYFGDLDNLKLYGTGSIALDFNELTLENGDFELGNANNWSLTGYSEVSEDQWAANNASYALSLWLSDDAEASGAASYSVALTAGTYYFTFDLSGGAQDSGLGYAVTAGETELAKSEGTYTTGGWDVWQTESTGQFTLTEDTTVTFTLSGTQSAKYFGDLDNLKLYGTGKLAEKIPEPVEAEIYVPRIPGTGGDFMRGMDVSSLLSILNSGATFKDWDGNTLDGQGFMNLLAASGTNWIRLRVWNNPFDASGNGYGGGNNDVAAAVTMGKWATNAGMKVLIDFHYSDFWADPGKQQAPKAWAGYTVDQKVDAIYEYTKTSLQTLRAAGVNVGMVQIGNETTNSMCGVSNWADRAKLFSAGAKAVREVDPSILVAIHFTNPERSGNYANFAKQLDTYGVDYDVFASSYYPYWHGTLANLTSVLKQVADTYGKYVIVAETSWGYTLDDGDGHDNTVRKNNNDSATYPFSAQGQASEIAAVTQAVRNVGAKGMGIFYWEPAWIPVRVHDGTQESLNANKALWEKHGSGWASSFAGEYDPNDAGVWYGGSSWDNQALFDFEGKPLPSLNTYLYMQSGTSGFDIQITAVESPTQNYTVGDTLALPQTLTVSYNIGSSESKAVVWNEADVAAVDMTKPGTYTVKGTIDGTVEAVCTVIVKGENLLVNPGMEGSDMSMYSISQAYARRKTDDPHSGSYSMHFYNSGLVDFTAEQAVTLKPGHYEFSLYGQGGNVGEDAKTYAYVKIGDQVLTKDFALTGWAIWANPVIEFDVTAETTVTVGVNVTASQNGAWGTFDDWYLCKDTTPTHLGGTATCKDPAICIACGESYGQADPTAHTGGTATCKDAAVCALCGQSYGEKDADNHTGGTEVRNAKEATQTAEGYTGDTHCKGCDAVLTKGESIPNLPATPDSPPTGDHSSILLFTGFAVLSLLAAAVLVLGKRRFL